MKVHALGVANKSLDIVLDTLTSKSVRFSLAPKSGPLTVVVGLDCMLSLAERRPLARFLVVDTLSAFLGTGVPVAGMRQLHGGTYITTSPLWPAIAKFVDLGVDVPAVALRNGIPLREFYAQKASREKRQGTKKLPGSKR